jgi:hypothetical protein
MLKIVHNNTKLKDHVQLWQELERKWKQRDSRNSFQQGFTSVRKKSRTTLLDGGAEDQSDRQVLQLSKP